MSPTLPRTWTDACVDALPDLLAALACGIAWRAPQALGFDLLAYAAPLFFIELPLALMFLFADAWRVPGEFLTTRGKLGLIVIPATLIGALCFRVFGVTGLIAIAWLGGQALWRLLREGEDRRPPPTGRWLVLAPRGKETERWLTRKRPDKRERPEGSWILPFAHNQFLPGTTILAWAGLFLLLMLSGAEVPEAGATAVLAQAAGWTATPIGREIPAHEALAAGLALFAVRCASHFDDLDEPPPANIEDDALLREVIEKVEGRAPKRGKAKRRRRS